MSISSDPAARNIDTDRLVLKWMTPEFIAASLERRRSSAADIIGAELPGDWPAETDARRLLHRLGQMEKDPIQAEWLLRAIVRRVDGAMVGYITFHEAPADGRAELGYTVFEPYRRCGYATEATLGMMRWAHERHGVGTFILSISPENAPSLGVARKLGFERTGSQIDEVDGLEWVFELQWKVAART